jgi:hypothetical protein
MKGRGGRQDQKDRMRVGREDELWLNVELGGWEDVTS